LKAEKESLRREEYWRPRMRSWELIFVIRKESSSWYKVAPPISSRMRTWGPGKHKQSTETFVDLMAGTFFPQKIRKLLAVCEGYKAINILRRI
jgi:hypothetical protein